MPNGAKYYVFTVNNPPALLDEDAIRRAGVSYLVYSEEVGESGTPHFQGYIELAKRKTIKALKKINSLETAHFEQRRGTQEQAIAYASKINDPTFISGPYGFGEPTTVRERSRTDLVRLKADLDRGHSMQYIAQEHFSSFLRYGKMISEYQRVVHPRYEEKYYTIESFNRGPLDLRKAVLLHGPGGTGKTEYAISHFNFCLFVRHIDELRNLVEGYHDGIVFDDMDFSHWPHGSRVHILDMNRAAQIHCRYSHAIIPRGMRRIFTSNSAYIFWKEGETEDQRSAIDRRLEVIRIENSLFATQHVAVAATTAAGAAVVPNVVDLTTDEALTNIYLDFGTGVADLYD